MRIFAPDVVSAKSRFWYFMKMLKKLKKTVGEIVMCSEVSHVLFVYQKYFTLTSSVKITISTNNQVHLMFNFRCDLHPIIHEGKPRLNFE